MLVEGQLKLPPMAVNVVPLLDHDIIIGSEEMAWYWTLAGGLWHAKRRMMTRSNSRCVEILPRMKRSRKQHLNWGR